MSKYNMVDLDGNNLGVLDSGSNTVKNSSGKVVYTIKGKYLISESDDEVYTVSSDGRVADESGKQVGYIYNYKDFKADQSTKKSTTKSSSSTVSKPSSSTTTTRTSTTTKSSTTTSKPKSTPASNSTSTTSGSKSSLSGWLWFAGIVLVLIWLFGPKSIEGTWSLYEIKYNGETYRINEKDLKKWAREEAEKEGYDYTEAELDEAIEYVQDQLESFHINFNKDGTGSVSVKGMSIQFKWHKKSGSTYVIEYEGNALEPGTSGEITVKGNKIVFDKDYAGNSVDFGEYESLTFKKD